MKQAIAFLGLAALAACGQLSGGGGVGFSTGPGTSNATAAAMAPTSVHDRKIATVKPSVLAKMRAAEPAKVYTSTYRIAPAELAI